MLPWRPFHTYDLTMQQKDDSWQGSLFLDGELPTVQQGRVPSFSSAPVTIPADEPIGPVRIHLRRKPKSRFALARWWRALVGGC